MFCLSNLKTLVCIQTFRQMMLIISTEIFTRSFNSHKEYYFIKIEY